ncbi:MAG: hypothetical protein HY736_08440 [Verrucomicrobia bacterium]|nr:hypothetical protein [Verrucomicrobiota bacterium]
MRDADGLCRSFLSLQTLRPLTHEELGPDWAEILRDNYQNAPDKAGCLSYENSITQLHPAIDAVDTARRVLGRLTDIRQMTNPRVPRSISDTSVSSWLLAYWRLKEFGAL